MAPELEAAPPTPASQGEIRRKDLVTARVCAAILVAAAGTVLAGWLLGIDALTRLQPGWPSMKFNTAVSLLALGVAIGLHTAGRPRAAGLVAVLPLALASFALLEHATGVGLGINNLLVADRVHPATPTPGRMSALTAFCLVGLSLAMMAPRRRPWMHEVPALAALGVAAYVLANYLYAASAVLAYTDVALATAVCIAAAAVGTQAARPSGPVARLFSSHDLGGKVARLTIAATVALPFVLGYIHLRIVQAGLLGVASAVALTAILVAATATVGIVVVAHIVQRLDARQKQQAQELAAALRRVEEAEEATVRASWSWTASRPHAWSRSMHRLLGVPTPDTSPESIARLLHPDDQGPFRAAMEQAFRQAGTHRLDARLVRPDGTTRWLRFEGASTGPPGGAPTSVAGHVQDVTELKALELVRQEAHDHAKDVALLKDVAGFKTQFINLAAHELRTPLTPIKVSLAALRHQTRDLPGGPPRSLAAMERNVDRLSLLAQSLVEAAQMQSEGIHVARATTDVDALVARVVQAFQPAAEAKRIALSAAGHAPQTALDGKKLEAVLHHLVGNALKFTPPQGTVRIEAAHEDGQVAISVHDTGRGFTAEQAGRLFQPFVQVHPPMEVSDLGPGLGLYLSRMLVEAQGGRITASSPGPGKGSMFCVRLPAGEAPPPSVS